MLAQVTLLDRWGTTLVGSLMRTQNLPVAVPFTLRLETQGPALPACFLERPSTAPVRCGPWCDPALWACSAAVTGALSQISYTRGALPLTWFQGRNLRFRVALAPPLICFCPLSSFFPIFNVNHSSQFPCSISTSLSSSVNALASYFSEKMETLKEGLFVNSSVPTSIF